MHIKHFPHASLAAALFAGLLAFSSACFAEPGSIGFSLAISADGIFNPTLTDVKVKSVNPNSAAEAAGLQAGDVITSIDGCKIPGCPGAKAKEAMAKEAGQTLVLTIAREGQPVREVTLTLRKKT